MSQTPKIKMPDQRAVTDQLRDLVHLANRNGLYDAADWINTRLPQAERVTTAEAILEVSKTLKTGN